MFFLLCGAVVATVLSLFFGLFHFWNGGNEAASLKSNRWMRWRVAFQGLAVLVFFLMFLWKGM